MEYEIIFYIDDKGQSPVKEFLNELKDQAKHNKISRQLLEKMYFNISMLERLGTRAGLPYTKHIEDKIWELRPKDYRILFFMWEENNIVLLSVFRKEKNKTPKREIIKAKNRMNDWIKHGHERQKDL